MNTKSNLPSVVNPHKKFYRETPTRELKTDQSMYDIVFESNKDNMAWPAVKYLSKTWSFRELKTKTDQLADAFVKAGVKEGDTILVGLSNCIEVVMCLLAINRIGAVSKWIDIRATALDLEKDVTDNSSKIFIAFESLLPIIEQMDTSCGLDLVITVSPVEQMPLLSRAVFDTKSRAAGKTPNRSISNFKTVRFRDFICGGNPHAQIVQPPFDPTRPSVIIQSSGTTGKPKTIVHSDISATTSAWSFTYSDLPTVVPGTRVLVLLPPWIAYSLGQTMVCCLSCGACIILGADFADEAALVNHLKEDSFDTCCGVPLHYRYLYDNFSKLSEDCKHKVYSAKGFITGGDKLSPDENKAFDDTFHCPLVNGYGNNECWGCITVNCIKDNHYGTVGIPKYGVSVISYSNELGCELPFNQLGEICVKSNTMFLCYNGNMAETLKVKQQHSDGNIWLHTGDLGYITEDGFIVLKGRIRRVITRRSYKISAYTIEDAITSLPMVTQCAVVEVPDVKEGGVPMAYVVLNEVYSNEDLSSVEKIIMSKCQTVLKDYEIPKYIRFCGSLPYTTNKKYDFTALEIDGSEYVNSIQEIK